ncbi:hypothetical protein OPV22_016692 [Ensete ventricosum]|uniref:Myb-like domain-containing protein n=1 Tax=Ensete ventricosum TaxID=4639 RepID=A0AAV8QWD4_ENSVE|nr:hypothetical protein OPV22_016692 [Ensete ventricosum]
MGASANPSGNPDGANGGPLRAGGARGVSDEGGAGSSVPGNPSNGATPGPAQALKHNPGLSIEWSAEEQTILEEGLSKYASESIIVRYAKIAMELRYKTVRDVALRCRWLSKKENNKRRKEDHNLARKSKDKKEKVTDSAKSSGHLGTRPNVPPYALPMLPVDEDDISYKAIGGRTGELLENNAETFTKISANFANLRIQDNINLFCQTRGNILAILKDLNDMPEIMKQMPPLPENRPPCSESTHDVDSLG